MSSLSPEVRDEKKYVNRYFAVDRIADFDNTHFRFTPQEAALTDPQHRLLLTCAYKALLDAGYPSEPTQKKFGVFATTSISTYLLNVLLQCEQYKKGEVNYPILIGNDKDFLATRIAYKLNLTGPALTIQCACSSSLVALHHACRSLANGECDLSITGGVSLSVPQEQGYLYKEGGILSPDGICRPFDKKANGTIKGNGCSVLVLKRLNEAVADEDRIYAVIKGTAINNDGASKVGFTAPSIIGQREVVQEALSHSGISPENIDYIETHGTATKLGDLIELAALYEVFQKVRKKIPLGSLKANIGHLDVAAGISSVVKLIYILNKATVPPLTHFSELNPELREFSYPFCFPTEPMKQELSNVCVSSFGIGGTNAHAVISRYNGERPSRPQVALQALNERAFWVQSDAHESQGDVIDIWKEVIGEKAIDKDSNYLDLGGDSLAALEIIDKINKRFSVTLTLDTFQHHLTPMKLQEWIKTQKRSLPLLQLKKSHESNTSLFLIHPAGGTTFCYHLLNQHLKGDYNLFVIDFPDDYAQYRSMEELGAYYLQEIKRKQPVGPYSIGGYSFGGNLAYEIAVQLFHMNEKVSKVIMFDSHTPEAYYSIQKEEIQYEEAFSEILKFFKERQAIEFFYNKWIYSHKLLKKHRQTQKIPADLTLFVAEERENEEILHNLSIAKVSKDNWSEYCSGSFKKIPVSGNHYTMFSVNHVAHLSHCFDKEVYEQ